MVNEPLKIDILNPVKPAEPTMAKRKTDPAAKAQPNALGCHRAMEKDPHH